LLTNDPGFRPSGKGNAPSAPPTQPGRPRRETASNNTDGSRVGITWGQSIAPQGVRYYRIHRSTGAGFNAAQGTLIGSATEPRFVDLGLAGGRTYHYRVVAVDNWGNQSAPSEELSVTCGKAQ
jgi:hypothetical protein